MLSPRPIFENNIRPADFVLKAMKRRNDIVHGADRSQKDPGGAAQGIDYPWATQAVETIRISCLALDGLVANRLKDLKELAAESQAVGESAQ